MTVLWFDHVPSPLGMVTLVASDSALCALDFPIRRSRMLERLRSRFSRLALKRRGDPNGYATRVRAYFSGDFGALDEIAVDSGGTPFQEQVWSTLRKIPVGATMTYREIAQLLRQPRAIRAVGLANARNPVCLVIPCNRVIGSDGCLRGYASGIWRKQWLLQHEGALPPA